MLAKGVEGQQVPITLGDAGRTTQIVNLAARTTSYTYDNLDRLTGYTHDQAGVLESHSFTYYPSFDRKTETVIVDGVTQKARTFTYDETHWLTGIADTADGSGGVISYQYDNNGNTLRKTDGTGQGPASTVMAYNSRNQLLSVATGAAGAEVAQGHYDYNYAGMRIRHLGSARGDIEYIYDDNAIIDELVSGTAMQVAHYRYGDRLLSLQTAEGEQFYHYSNIGTTANLSTPQGQNQVAYEVDPFGAITRQEGESVNRQVFTGHEHDTETGLIYMKARFYDPDSARFLTQDTYLGVGTEAPSLHRYMYAYSNPTVYVDPDGHSVFQFEPGLQQMQLQLMEDGRAKELAMAQFNFEQANMAPFAAGIMAQTAKDAATGAAHAAAFVGNTLLSPFSSTYEQRAADSWMNFFGTVDSVVSSKGSVITDGLLAAHYQATEQLQSGQPYQAGKSAAPIAQTSFAVSTFGLSAAPSAVASSAKVVNAGIDASKHAMARMPTLERAITSGGNQINNVASSVVGKAKLVTATLVNNAMASGPNMFQRQTGAVGSWSNNSGKSRAISDISVTPGPGREGPSYSMTGVVDGEKQALGRALTIEKNGWTYIDWYEVSEAFAGNRLSDQLLQGIIDHVGSSGKVIEGSPGGINREVLKTKPIEETPWAKAFDRLGYDTEYDAQDRVMRSTKRK